MFANIQQRIYSIDIVRGIVMIIMALDHVRDLIHLDYPLKDPLDFNTTTPALFLTRIVTHLCAPTFVFLTGVSTYLSILKENNLKKSRSFLIKRGLWLVFLELTVISFLIFCNINFDLFLFQVIGAIGICYLILALLLSLNAKTITAIGLTIVLFHNLLDFLNPAYQTYFSGSFLIGGFPLGDKRFLAIGYPPIPWLGILMVGFGSGILFLKEQALRKKLFYKIGAGMLLAFIIIRFMNVYGNATPWEVKSTPVFTILSFFDLTKYPPSLLFDLCFLGIMFLLLGFFEKQSYPKWTNIVLVFGSVPLFYYVVHWIVMHIVKFVVLAYQGYNLVELFNKTFARPLEPNGLGLGGVYICWIIVIILMYPLCVWYSRYKKANRSKEWLRYL